MSTYSRIANHHRVFHELHEIRTHFIVYLLGVDRIAVGGSSRGMDFGFDRVELEIPARAFGGVVAGPSELAGAGL